MNTVRIIALSLIVSACSDPTVDTTPVEPLAVGDQLTAVRDVKGDFSDPENTAWRSAQAYEVELTLAPPVHPSINLRHDETVPAIPVQLRAAIHEQQLFVRLRWADSVMNTVTSRTEFADAIAVQFALEGGAATSFMMGHAGAPVNIWYWKAGREYIENLAAAGFGSTTMLDPGSLAVTSRYDAGFWTVVMTRALASSGEYEVNLTDGTPLLSLAVWQGGKEGRDGKDGKAQRDGLKHVAMGWMQLN